MPEIVSLNEINAERESLIKYLTDTRLKEKQDEFYSRLIANLSIVQINILISHLVDLESFTVIAARLNLSRTTTYKLYLSARLIITETLRPSHGTL